MKGAGNWEHKECPGRGRAENDPDNPNSRLVRLVVSSGLVSSRRAVSRLVVSRLVVPRRDTT